MSTPPPPPKKKLDPSNLKDDIEHRKKLDKITAVDIEEGDIPVSAKSLLTLDPLDVQAEVRRLLKFSTYVPETRYWLDTGSPDLNAALGSRKKGIPFGKIIMLSGLKHGGKTAVSLVLAGLAQQDGAAVGYIDLERSRDETWESKLGLDPNQVLPIKAMLVKPRPKKKSKNDKPLSKEQAEKEKKKAETAIPVLQGAEDLFAEAEAAMHVFRMRGFHKQFWLVDSIAMLQTWAQVDAGVQQNMRTRLDRAIFLNDVLPRWAALADNYGAMIVFVNQLRMKQGMVFGDPYSTPGGMALDHACTIQARVARKSNGRMLDAGKVVGIVGVISNYKNKAGSGSVEQCKAGFKIKWNRNPALIKFFPGEDADDILKEEQ